MMKRSNKIATIFDAIFKTFLIWVKVITLLRINYICTYEKTSANGCLPVSKLTIIVPNFY